MRVEIMVARDRRGDILPAEDMSEALIQDSLSSLLIIYDNYLHE